MIKAKCVVCGKSFEAKRTSARTCSNACRQKQKRVGMAKLQAIGAHVVHGSKPGEIPFYFVRRKGGGAEPIYYSQDRLKSFAAAGHGHHPWCDWYQATRHTMSEAKKIIERESKHIPNAEWEIVDASQVIRAAMEAAAERDRLQKERNQPVMFVPSKADQEAAMKELSKHFSVDKQLRSKDHPDLTVRGEKPKA